MATPSSSSGSSSSNGTSSSSAPHPGNAADAQLVLLAKALQGEPLLLYSIDRAHRITWTFNWFGPLKEQFDAAGSLYLPDLIEGPTAKELLAAIDQAFETGSQTTFLGQVNFVYGHSTYFRGHFVPVTLPDGTQEVLARAYDLSQLSNEEADRQLELLSEGLRDEPMTLARYDQDLNVIWSFNFPKPELTEQQDSAKLNSVVLSPESVAIVTRYLRQAFETGQPVSFQETLAFIDGGTVTYRVRYVPVDRPDGTREVLGTAYNLTQLVSEQADKQLQITAEALRNEPIFLYRINQDLRFTWQYNFPDELESVLGPLPGQQMRDVLEGPNLAEVEHTIRTAFEANRPTAFEGLVEVKGVGPIRFRSRFVPTELADGSIEVFATAYNLTALVNEQADKQLDLIVAALQDEPIVLFRMNRDLEYTWRFNSGTGTGSTIPGLVYRHLGDSIQGAGYESLADTIRQAIDTNQAASWEGTIEYKSGGYAQFRDRIVPVTRPDGTREVLIKAYNLTVLVTEQADKQLGVLSKALEDEPVFFYRINRQHRFTWQYNFPAVLEQGLGGPLVGQFLTDLVVGPTTPQVAAAIDQAFETGQPVSYEGSVEGRGIGTFNFRVRFVPIQLPDGTTEVFAKNYNLTALVSQQADKQLGLVAEALQDEPLVLYRINRELKWTWWFNWGGGVLDAFDPGREHHFYDMVQGKEADRLADAIRHAIDHNEVTSWEGIIEFTNGSKASFRDRIVPVDMPNGTREALVKAYNLTELTNQEADKQLAIITEALKDEPIVIYRMNRDLVYTTKIKWGGGILDGYSPDTIERLYDIVEGKAADELAACVRHTIDTGEISNYEGNFDFVGGGSAIYRARFVPVTMPDGTREALVKGYNLTELQNEEAQKQLALLTEALNDEPVSFSRLDEDLNYLWVYNAQDETADAFGGDNRVTGRNMRDIARGPGFEAAAKAVKEAIRTGKPTSYEGEIEIIGRGVARIRGRYVPITGPDGKPQVFAKIYNLDELVSQQAERQLALLTYALTDEPISFARLDDKLNYVWVYNGEHSADDPLTSKRRNPGHNFYKITQGPTSKVIGGLMEQALATGVPTEYEGFTHIIGQQPFRIRGRYIPITQPDGSRQIFAKIYNLTELVNQEADKQLLLLTDALEDEPISFSRVDESMHYTWIYQGGGSKGDPLGSPVRGVGKHVLEVATGPGIQAVYDAIQETFRTGEPNSFEGVLDMIGLAPMKVRARFVRVTMPDGSYQVFNKTYNLSELVSQEGDKQLTLLAEALKDEPIILARTDADLRWNWVFNPSTVAADEEVVNRPIGKTIYDFFDKESADKIAPLMRQAVATGEATSFEGLVYLKAGGSMHYRARYVPVTTPTGERNLLIKGYNFSELATAQAHLANSEARFRIALEHEPLSLAIQDRWGNFLWQHNPHPLFPAREGGRFYSNMPRAQMARLLKIKRRVIDTGQPYTGDMWLDTLDKEKAMYARVVYHPYRLPDGRAGVIGKKYDLTTYRLAEERERETARNLAEERKELKKTLAELKKAHAEKLLELEEARLTQLSLLPTGSPAQIDYATYYATCVEVGGDYYDYFEKAPEDGDGLLLAVGDATGHGLRSAMMVSVVKGYLQLLAHAMPPGKLLERVDKAIKTLGLKRLYMGLLLLERRPGGYAFASAGMPAVLVYRTATGQIESHAQPRIFLGTELAFPYFEESFISMSPGDVLVALSDGLIEANNPSAQQLGLAPIEAAIAKAAPQGCQAVVDALVQLQTDWQAGNPLRDDTTIMALGA